MKLYLFFSCSNLIKAVSRSIENTFWVWDSVSWNENNEHVKTNDEKKGKLFLEKKNYYIIKNTVKTFVIKTILIYYDKFEVFEKIKTK